MHVVLEVIAVGALHRSLCAKENFDRTRDIKNAVNRKLFLGRMSIFIVDLLAFQMIG